MKIMATSGASTLTKAHGNICGRKMRRLRGEHNMAWRWKCDQLRNLSGFQFNINLNMKIKARNRFNDERYWFIWFTIFIFRWGYTIGVSNLP